MLSPQGPRRQRTCPSTVALALTVEAPGGEGTICLNVTARQTVEALANQARRYWPRQLRGRAAAPSSATLNPKEPLGVWLRRCPSGMGHRGGTTSWALRVLAQRVLRVGASRHSHEALGIPLTMTVETSATTTPAIGNNDLPFPSGGGDGGSDSESMF
jgi:hypothetical protein